MRTQVDEDQTIGVALEADLHSLQTESFIRNLITSLRASIPEYLPDVFQVDSVDRQWVLTEGPLTPLNEDACQQLARSLQTEEPRQARLTKGDPPVVTISLASRLKHLLPYDSMVLQVRRAIVGSPEGRRELIRAVHVLAEVCGAFFGAFGSWRTVKIGSFDSSGAQQVIQGSLALGLPPPEWGFFLGREYVALLGADRLRSAPCEVVREQADGSFFLLLAEDFAILENDPDLLEQRREGLVRHIGPEYFFYIPAGRPKKVPPRFADLRPEQ